MKEIRVFVISEEQAVVCAELLTDEQFMEMAEDEGGVYTLRGFEWAFNNEAEIYSNLQYIRFIEVENFN